MSVSKLILSSARRYRAYATVGIYKNHFLFGRERERERERERDTKRECVNMPHINAL